jgi:hypothetical protein
MWFTKNKELQEISNKLDTIIELLKPPVKSDLTQWIEKENKYSGSIKVQAPLKFYTNGGERNNVFAQMINKGYSDRETQLFNTKVAGKIDLIEWAFENYRDNKMSRRTYNTFLKTKTLYGLTIDELTWEEYNKYRGCGKKSWEEFEKLRNQTI